jgi:hypothetical protein
MSALGWSELPWYSRAMLFEACLFREHGRKLCFANTPQDLAAAQAAGCSETINSCTTTDNNAGKVWCCPQDRPRPYVTTPQQIARSREIAAAEQQQAAAADERAFIEPAQGPISVEPLKIARKVGPVAAIVLAGAAIYSGYRYFGSR